MTRTNHGEMRVACWWILPQHTKKTMAQDKGKQYRTSSIVGRTLVPSFKTTVGELLGTGTGFIGVEGGASLEVVMGVLGGK
jgi:hypothetical protein